jgi:hypothetical protein
MKIRKLDGSSVIEINAIDSRVQQAVDAENSGYPELALQKLDEAIKAERDLWVVKNVKQRMLGLEVVDYGIQITDEDIKNLDWGDTTPHLG